MKKFYKYLLLSVAAVVLAACSGTIDPEAGNDDNLPQEDPKTQVPEGVLRIFADKTQIAADGNEEVTFTVMYGSEDVSNAKTLQLIRKFNGSEKYMAYGANKFTTTTAGTYEFSAKYYYAGNNYTDNSVTIPAGWNVGNMRVIAAAMTSGDGGYNWKVNNVNECKLGESASYIYEE